MPKLKNLLDTMDALGVKEIDSTRLVGKLEELGFARSGIDSAIQGALAGGNMLYTHKGLLCQAQSDQQNLLDFMTSKPMPKPSAPPEDA